MSNLSFDHQKQQLGFGLGLRPEHYTTILAEHPEVDWFEILTDNYLVPGGKALQFLHQIRARYPIVMHGVSMSLGSTDPIDVSYLREIKLLANQVEPQWISDHLCWTGVQGKNTHDLLPLPYTEEAVFHVVGRIKQVQEILERRILIENVSSYLTYQSSSMTEWEFLKTVSEQADCLILLDINNIYVSSINHGFDPLEYLDAMPKERVWQMHLAGHSNLGDHIIDTHDHDIVDRVWQLYGEAIRRIGLCSTMIERDDHIPPLAALLGELMHARTIANQVTAEIAA